MKFASRAIAFTVGLGIGILIQISYPDLFNKTDKPCEVVQEQIAITNIFDRTSLPLSTNLNWFTDSNSYIWDGWKIK